MQIESLRYFVELARARSFYGAAKQMHISQQGLNKAVRAIESELGVKLVERTRRGVRLTSAGEVFLTYAEEALELNSRMLDELYAEHHYMAPEEDTRLVFHVSHYPAQIVRPFFDGMRAVDLARIAEEPFRQVIDAAAASDGSELFVVDVHGNSFGQIAARNGLIFEPLFVTQFGVVWPDGSPLAGYRAIHREQLANFPLAVDTHPESMQLIAYVMEDYPLNNIRVGMSDTRATLDYATKSVDVAATFDSFGFMLAQGSSRIQTDGLHFTPFSTPRSMCQIGFLYARSAKPNVRARHAIDRLKRYVEETYPEYMARYPLEK